MQARVSCKLAPVRGSETSEMGLFLSWIGVSLVGDDDFHVPPSASRRARAARTPCLTGQSPANRPPISPRPDGRRVFLRRWQRRGHACLVPPPLEIVAQSRE